jgi:elongator complex protein 6
MTSRIPLLLEPYLSLPPEASLILLTSVLGASTNWLVLRFLYNALAAPTTGTQLGARRDTDGIGKTGEDGDWKGEEEGEGTRVVLASFLRDLTFWREGGRRLVSLGNSGRFCFGELKLTIICALGFGSAETSYARKICLRRWAEWTVPARDRDGERW